MTWEWDVEREMVIIWQLLARLAARAEDKGNGWEEMKERDLPRCEGSRIMEIDIVMVTTKAIKDGQAG